MKIISEQLIRSLEISPVQCVEWIKESFSLKKDAQLPAKISVHPQDKDFFTSMPCLLPEKPAAEAVAKAAEAKAEAATAAAEAVAKATEAKAEAATAAEVVAKAAEAVAKFAAEATLASDPAAVSAEPVAAVPSGDSVRRYFGVKEVHRLEGAVPSLGSDLMLYDAESGKLLAIMDCDWITTMRTGAVAALSAKTLRRQSPAGAASQPIEPTAVGPTAPAGTASSCVVYGMLGLGNTARATLLCALEAEPETHFKVKLLRYKDQAEQFAARFNGYPNVEFETVGDMREMLAGELDVLISCVTCADGLLVEDESLFKPGITVIPVHTRGFQNCDRVFDRVFGDDTAHVRGFKFFSEFRDYAEIGDVFDGRDPGRRGPEERILDYNVGLGLHDVVYASKIYEMLACRADVPEVAWEKETEKFWI